VEGDGVRGQVKVIDPRGFDEGRPTDADGQVGLSGYRHPYSYGTQNKIKDKTVPLSFRGHISHKMEVNHKSHASAFSSPGTDPHYPLKIRLEGFHSRFEHVGKKRDKSLPLPGIELRNPVRSFFLSLYSLSYPGSPQNKRRVLRFYRDYVSGCYLGMGPY